MDAGKPTDDDDRRAEARLMQITNQLDRKLSADQLDQVRKRIGRSIELAEQVHSTPLTNSDEPEIVFQPYRRQER